MALTDIPGLTYTRTGSATAWRADGTLAEFAPNVPRITDKGVLIEGQRTNLLVNSAWAGGATVTSWSNSALSADAASSISGGVRARSFVTSASRSYMEQSISFASGAAYCLSVVVEDVSEGMTANQVVSVAAGGFTGSYLACEANPAGGAGGSVRKGRLLYVVTNLGATVAVGARFGLGVNGNTTGSCRLSLPQVEQASYASSPIITTGAAATRGADDLYMSVSDALLRQPYTVVVEIDELTNLTTANFENLFIIGDQGVVAPNRIEVYRATNALLALVRVDAAIQTTMSIQAIWPKSGPLKAALTFDGINSYRLAARGMTSVAGVVSKPFSQPLSRIDLFRSRTGAWIGVPGRRFVILPFAASDAQLQAMTQ